MVIVYRPEKHRWVPQYIPQTQPERRLAQDVKSREHDLVIAAGGCGIAAAGVAGSLLATAVGLTAEFAANNPQFAGIAAVAGVASLCGGLTAGAITSAVGTVNFFRKSRETYRLAKELKPIVPKENPLPQMIIARHGLGIGELAWTLGDFILAPIAGAIISTGFPPAYPVLTAAIFGFGWWLRGKVLVNRFNGYNEAKRQLHPQSWWPKQQPQYPPR